MTCLHNIRYKKLYDNKVFPLGSTEKLFSSTQNDTFSNPRRYAFLLKEARIYWKIYESEEDNRKKQRKKAFLLSLSKYLCTFAKTKNPGSSPASNNLGEGLTGTALQR